MAPIVTAEPAAESDDEAVAAMSALLANLLQNVQATTAPTDSAVEQPTLTIIGAEDSAEVAYVTEPQNEIVEQPTVEATAVPTVEPIIVPYGEAVTFDTEMNADGSARKSTDSAEYETLNLTLAVDGHRDPAYFEATYAESFDLQGNEAVVELDLTLNGYEGSSEIIPQDFLLITFIGEDESAATQGFQLMDSEINGKIEIAVTSDTPATLYKRYPYDANLGDMEYMVVTAYVDGKPVVYWFEINAPEAVATPVPETDSLSVGSTGEAVNKLQAKLIELGLLSGVPDGVYGNYTASAVQEMQRRFGMEQTGIADAAFLARLYA